MTLHTKILDAARDEVARENGFNSWSGAVNGMLTHISNEERLLERHEQAALLAMDRQAEFFRWAAEKEWEFHGIDKWWSYILGYKTELELYEIFTTQQ